MTTEDVESLVHHASEEAAVEPRLRRVVSRWVARYGLSEAESHVLLMATEGHDRAAIATIRGSSAAFKNHIHNLLQKTGDSSLQKAVDRLLREALNG